MTTEEKKSSETVKIYARVRQLMPWEPKKISLQIKGNKLRNHTGKTTNEYSFHRVFPIEWTNEEMFTAMVEPMISNVLKGFNALLIAYGQTGSGKTFSMLGKPHLNVVGLLPYMLKRVVESPGVNKVELCAVEAFGHHVARIELFDLFDPDNQTPNWAEKKGNTSLDPSKATRVQIKDMNDAYQKIEYAHRGSHFAPTGKNPESSRGHVTFIASITQTGQDSHGDMTSYFAMVDCAGSEGESAFTDEFKNAVDKTTLMARRLEAGCINTGLSQLQIIFNELSVKGKLSEMRGNGLRRVLHPYINTRTFLSVLFTFSPSANNSKPTESTLKFAVTAGMVKVQPVKVELSVNMEQLVKQLRQHIEQNDKLIAEQSDKIIYLRKEIEKYTENTHHHMNGGDEDDDDDENKEEIGEEAIYVSTLAKEMSKRQEQNHSTLPTRLLTQLKELDEDNDEERYKKYPQKEEFDEKVYIIGEGLVKMSQKDIDKEMDVALQRMQKTNRGDEMIQKVVTIDQNKSNVDKTKDAMQQLAGTLAAATFDPSLATDPEEEQEVVDKPIARQIAQMDKQELKETCMDTLVKIEKTREKQAELQKKQQALVSHLVETNEWLFDTLSDILNGSTKSK